MTPTSSVSQELAAPRSIRCLTPTQKQSETSVDRPNSLTRISCYWHSCTAVDDFVIARDWRENRTLFHTGQAYRISESYAWKIVRAVEISLINDGRFHLPGKKSLLAAGHAPERVRMDCHRDADTTPQPATYAVGTAVENRDATTAAKGSNTR